MKRYCGFITITTAAILLAASCEGGISTEGTGSQSKGTSIKVNVSETGSVLMSKASDALTATTRVFSDDEDDFTITEYVSDMNATEPITKGQQIVTNSSLTGHYINQDGESFGVLAYYETDEAPSQPIEAKGLDIEGSCKYNSGWSWDASTKQYTTTYDGSGHYSNAMTVTDPCWRVKSTERIWSIYPTTAPNRVSTTGAYTDLEDKISASAPSSFTFGYTVSTVLEDQKDLLFAYNKEARNWKKAGTAPDPNAWVWDDGDNNEVSIKFYHALAAVKFQLSSSAITAGTNVHSITLCYMDASKNIVKEVGVARSGECTVTGADATNSVSFSWDASKLDTFRPLHYKFADTYSTPTPNTSTVAGGYTRDGNGVMFMIPQTLQHTISTSGGTATLKIIVEFSKYGSTHYHTVVKDFTSSNVTWDAGKYYLYQLDIGEFHVPGENLQLTDVGLSGLKNSAVQKVPADADAMNIKGVSKVGLVIDLYQLGAKEGQTVYMHAIINGADQVDYDLVGSGGNSVAVPSTTNSSFSFDFDSVDDTALDSYGNLYKFGDGSPEDYYKYYSFTERSGTAKGAMTSLNSGKVGPLYYVFETPGDGTKKFQIGFQPAAGDNSGGFNADVRCLIVLEITPDPNLPVNWDDFRTNLTDYL